MASIVDQNAWLVQPNQTNKTSEDTRNDYDELYTAALAAVQQSKSITSEMGPMCSRENSTPLVVSRDGRSASANIYSTDKPQLKIGITRWFSQPSIAMQAADAKERHPVIRIERIKRRTCYSLDEKALFDLHHHQRSSTISQQPTSWPQFTATEPTEPPFPPPKRTSTPDGVPSWPGLTQRQPTQPELPGNIIRRSHKKIRQAVAKALGRHQMNRNGKRARLCRSMGFELHRAAPRPVAPWRPPMSGHSTFRFGALESHPFNQAAPSRIRVGGTSGARRLSKGSSPVPNNSSNHRSHGDRMNAQSFHFQAPPEEDETPLLEGHNNARQDRTTSSNDSVVVSPSARALAALSDLPLPVSTARVEAQTARRSSSIPRSRLQSPAFGAGSQRRSTYPNSTVKTTDLIEAFPEPPLSKALRPVSAPTGRLSLFPALACLDELSGCTSKNGANGSQILASNPSDNDMGNKKLVFKSLDGQQQNSLELENSQLSCDTTVIQCSGALPNPAGSDGAIDNS